MTPSAFQVHHLGVLGPEGDPVTYGEHSCHKDHLGSDLRPS